MRTRRFTKEHAAGEQLDCAIKLFFLGESGLAVINLATACTAICRDVLKSRGKKSAFNWEAVIKPEHLRDFYRLNSRSKNFLKHADKDAEGELEIRVEEPEARLFEAVVLFQETFEKSNGSAELFLCWSARKNPKVFTDEGLASYQAMAKKAAVDLAKLDNEMCKDIVLAEIQNRYSRELS